MLGMLRGKPPPPRVEIARIVSEPVEGGSASFAGVMMLLGTLLLLFVLSREDSAIREAAEGTLWTGWNVMWGAVLISGRRRMLIVTREQTTP